MYRFHVSPELLSSVDAALDPFEVTAGKNHVMGVAFNSGEVSFTAFMSGGCPR